LFKAAALELTLRTADVQDALTAVAGDNMQDLSVDTAEGVLLLRLSVRMDPLPLPVPVELRFTVQSAGPDGLDLGVAWTNLGVLPAPVKTRALHKAFEALPGTYADGTYHLDLLDLVGEVPISFELENVKVSTQGVTVQLSDLVLFPVRPEAQEAAPTLVPQPATAHPQAQLPEHQSYYQGLRDKVRRWTERKAPKWVQPFVPWLLALPDFFVLVVRLARDERVPAAAKVLAAATVAYILSPVDLIPDILPIVGQVDDVAVALFAIEQIAVRVPGDVIQELWPGDGRVLDFVQSGTELFNKALPARLLAAIKSRVKGE